MIKRVTMLLLFAGLAFAPAHAQQRPQQPPQPPATREEPGNQPRVEVAGPAEEKISTTQHVVHLDGREIRYTATTGTLPIRLDDGKVAARMFFVAYTKDGEDAKTRPVSFLYNGGPGSATVWLHMGSFAPLHIQMARGRLPARAALQAGGKRELAHRRFGSRLRRRDLDRLQPHGRRREPGPVPWPGRRHPRVRRIHQQLPERVQPLAVAEVPHRRELRHDPLRRPLARAAVAPRRRAERHRPRLVAAHLSDAVARARQRHRLRRSDRDLRGDRVVPQEAAARSAAEDAQAGRRRGAHLRVRRLPGGAHQGQHAHRGGAQGDGGQARALHGPLGRSSSSKRTCASTPAASARN